MSRWDCIVHGPSAYVLATRECGGLLTFAAVAWRRWFARSAREPSVLASVADILRPEFFVWFLDAACTTGICVDLAALARVRRLAIGAGQSAILNTIGDVHWPETSR